jgi:hypothetical protein
VQWKILPESKSKQNHWGQTGFGAARPAITFSACPHATIRATEVDEIEARDDRLTTDVKGLDLTRPLAPPIQLQPSSDSDVRWLYGSARDVVG